MARHQGRPRRVCRQNLDREIEFYRDIFGLEFILRRIWDYEYVRQMVGIPYALLDIALLKLPGKEDSPLAEDGSLTPGKGDAMLELIEYNQPKGNPVDDSPNTLGNAHITSLVDDMDAIIARLREANATFRSRNLYIFSGYTWPQTQYYHLTRAGVQYTPGALPTKEAS